jgi:hypothetical protein
MTGGPFRDSCCCSGWCSWFTFLFTDPALNTNWAFGSGGAPQHWIDPPAYFAALLATWSLLMLVPMHLLVRRLFAPAPMGA